MKIKWVTEEEFTKLWEWVEATRRYTSVGYSGYVPDSIEYYDNEGHWLVKVAKTELMKALL